MIELVEQENGLFTVTIDESIDGIQRIFKWLAENDIRVFDYTNNEMTVVDAARLYMMVCMMDYWAVMPHVRLRMCKADAFKLRLAF